MTLKGYRQGFREYQTRRQAARCLPPGRGRTNSGELGPVGRQLLVLEKALSCSAHRRWGPGLALRPLWGYKAFSCHFFFHHCLCLMAGVPFLSEIVPEHRVFSTPERDSPCPYRRLWVGSYLEGSSSRQATCR